MRVRRAKGACLVAAPVRVTPCGAYVGERGRLVRVLGAQWGVASRRLRLPAGLGGSPRLGGEAGMSTAEYAVGTLGAAALAAVLYQVVTGDSVTGKIEELIARALRAPF